MTSLEKRREKHPGRFVTFVAPHEVVNPATVLETGEGRLIAEIPEKRTVYEAGQTLEFGSVNAARAFVKAMPQGVCKVGW